MAILDDMRDEISRRVAALDVGTQFSLRTLFGGREPFARIATSGQRKALGTQFRRSVESNNFQGVEYSHHAQSPAEHWYQRI